MAGRLQPSGQSCESFSNYSALDFWLTSDGYLGKHNLLRARTDAENYLRLACLNLVECVAFVERSLDPSEQHPTVKMG